MRNEIGEYEDAFYPHYDFQKLNQNIKCICPTTGKLVKFIDLWFEDEHARCYDTTAFYPTNGDTPDHIYNLFEGFDAKLKENDYSCTQNRNGFLNS